jgi:hypothetical protein
MASGDGGEPLVAVVGQLQIRLLSSPVGVDSFRLSAVCAALSSARVHCGGPINFGNL